MIFVGPEGPLATLIFNAAPFLEPVGGGEEILGTAAEDQAVRSRVAAGGRMCLACSAAAPRSFICRAVTGHYRSAFYLDLCSGHAAALEAELAG